MTKRNTTPWAAMAITVLLTGCGTMPNDSIGSRTNPVAILQHHQANDSGFKHATVELINSQQQIKSLGSVTLGKLNIDYHKQSLLVLALGERPTSGWSAKITGVQRRGSQLYLQGIAYHPKEGKTVSQALTYPIAVTVLQKVHANVIHPEIEDHEGPPAAAIAK